MHTSDVKTSNHNYASDKENSCVDVALDDDVRSFHSSVFQQPRMMRPALVEIRPGILDNVSTVSSNLDSITTRNGDYPEFHMRLIPASERDLLDQEPSVQSWLPSSTDTASTTTTTRHYCEQGDAAVRACFQSSSDAVATASLDPRSALSTHRALGTRPKGRPPHMSRASPTLRRRSHVYDLRKVYKLARDSPNTHLHPRTENREPLSTSFEHQLTLSMLAQLDDKPLYSRPPCPEIHNTPLHKAFTHLRTSLKGITFF